MTSEAASRETDVTSQPSSLIGFFSPPVETTGGGGRPGKTRRKMAAYDCYYPRFWDVSLAFGRRFSFLVVFGLRKTLNIIRRPHPSFPPPTSTYPTRPPRQSNSISFRFPFSVGIQIPAMGLAIGVASPPPDPALIID